MNIINDIINAVVKLLTELAVPLFFIAVITGLILYEMLKDK